ASPCGRRPRGRLSARRCRRRTPPRAGSSCSSTGRGTTP
ncbi:MAG: hypothetical protein AVDCRST_MAG64-3322, partial [uncultured Phycisphaerae bacterium]